MYTSVDTDGRWSSLDDPCVPIPETRKLLETKYSVISIPAGDTILYSGGETVMQLDLETGRSEIVLRSDGISEFGVIGDRVVYYESNGDRAERRPIDVIIDHGASSTSRYERISPRHGLYNAGLITTPAGIYWWTSRTGDPHGEREEWRWNPETGTVEAFPLRASSSVVADEDSFLYFDDDRRLVVRPQLPGPPTLAIDWDDELQTPLPIALDGDDLFWVEHQVREPVEASVDQLITRGADRVERLLVETRVVTAGAVDPAYVYFTREDSTSNETRQNLYRVPRAGGPMETFFTGETNSAVFDVRVDRCNVYWQVFTVEGGALYGREITR